MSGKELSRGAGKEGAASASHDSAGGEARIEPVPVHVSSSSLRALVRDREISEVCASRSARARAWGGHRPGAKLFSIPVRNLDTDVHRVDLVETVRTHVLMFRRLGPPILPEALRVSVKSVRAPVLNVLVLDASGSMNFQRRIAVAKGVLQELVKRSYIERSSVAVIIARGRSAMVLAWPTRTYEDVFKQLRELPSGGATPLAHALYLALLLARQWRYRVRTGKVRIVLVTDGKANIPLLDDPVEDVVRLVEALQRERAEVLVFDTRPGQGIDLTRNCIDELARLGVKIIRV